MLRRSTSDDGVVALEFALIVPLFLLLIFATMAFALYFATFVAVIHGANEGARASVGGISTAERGTLAKASVQSIFGSYAPLLNPAHVVVDAQAASASMFRVTVSYPLSDLDFGAFYTLLAAASTDGKSGTRPTTIGYSVTVANGGY
ncbi:TadE/TadG family type IV pilus assembly protein [Glacieibacterium sp.]|uniref:TadE/TadG family type IV pilus assembly protein n=1 Tax=Glacieibacterium sp. TaxID=2860237 RepID=UPI003B0094B9